MNVNLFFPGYEPFYKKIIQSVSSTSQNKSTLKKNEEIVKAYTYSNYFFKTFVEILTEISTKCGFQGLNQLTQGLTFRHCAFLTVFFLAANTVQRNIPLPSKSANCTFSILKTKILNGGETSVDLFSKTVLYDDIVSGVLDNVVIDNVNGQIFNMISSNDEDFKNNIMEFIAGFATYAKPQANRSTLWDVGSFLQNNIDNPLWTPTLPQGTLKYNVSIWKAVQGGFDFSECNIKNTNLFRVCLYHTMFRDFMDFLCLMGFKYNILHNDLHPGNALITRLTNDEYKIIMIDYGRVTCSLHATTQTDIYYKLQVIRNGQPFPPMKRNAQRPTYRSMVEGDGWLFMDNLRPLILLDIACYFTGVYRIYIHQINLGSLVDRRSLDLIASINGSILDPNNKRFTTLDAIFFDYDRIQGNIGDPGYVAIVEGLFLMSILQFYLINVIRQNLLHRSLQWAGTQAQAAQFVGWIASLTTMLNRNSLQTFNNVLAKSLYLWSSVNVASARVEQFSSPPCTPQEEALIGRGVRENRTSFGQTSAALQRATRPVVRRPTRTMENEKPVDKKAEEFAKLFLFGPESSKSAKKVFGFKSTAGVPVAPSDDHSGMVHAFDTSLEMKKKLKKSQQN